MGGEGDLMGAHFCSFAFAMLLVREGRFFLQIVQLV